MKVLFINRSDSEGGAAKGATRLLSGVRPLGADAILYVQKRIGNNPLIIGKPAIIGRMAGAVRRIMESVYSGLPFRKMQGLFSPAFLPDRLNSKITAFTPDIIHLHWVARMMRLETLTNLKMPIVWTLHDSWPFTGGCFLPGDCIGYRGTCGKCPVLNSSLDDDLSRRVWQRKQSAWQNLNLTLVAPSRWMAECSHASSLFQNRRVEIIPNGLDIKLFQPSDKLAARRYLSLPQNKKLVLFGAKSATKDLNKGYHLLAQALHKIASSKWLEEIELIVFGSSKRDLLPDQSLKTHFMGWQNDDTTLALLYAAADVFVFPSMQESLGYTAMEAMACGTPCVAFRQGGVPDLINHEQNGYLARPFDPTDLAHGIMWVMENDERRRRIGHAARQKVIQKFSQERIAKMHMALYKEILG